MANQIAATVVADSINPWGDRITSMELVLPRIILSEFNTHRMFSRNSASSRAIPFKRMVEMVRTNPFVPIAWQKEHKGMQGTEYFTDEIAGDRSSMKVADILTNLWLAQRQEALIQASLITEFGGTKQLANRLLEPFMYHKVLMTATEFSNFFDLRSPQYIFDNRPHGGTLETFRSKLDAMTKYLVLRNFTTMEWLETNKGQAEIHMMDLAEKMWDAIGESKPKSLLPGEWHIPYEDKIHLPPTIPIDEGYTLEEGVIMRKVKISTGMGARVSYTTVGDEKEIKYETLIGIHDKMLIQRPFHASPYEHPAQCPTEEEYMSSIKGDVHHECIDNIDGGFFSSATVDDRTTGWFRNYRGWKQYRQIIEEKQS